MRSYESLNPILLTCMQDTTLPAFDRIKAEHVVPGIRELLAQLNADIDALEQDVVPTWAGLVEPIERIFDRLERAWGAVSHLKVGLAAGITQALATHQAGASWPACNRMLVVHVLGQVVCVICSAKVLLVTIYDIRKENFLPLLLPHLQILYLLVPQAVKDTKELRDAVETVQPERVKLALRLGQSRALYQGFQARPEF